MENIENDPNFMFVSAMGDKARLRELVASGSRLWRDPNVVVEPLHAAAGDGDRETIELFLGAGGQELINDFDDASFTPLMWAASRGHIDAVRLLLAHGASPNLREEWGSGNNALRQVIDEASFEMVKVLLDAGADPWMPGWVQRSAADEAERRAEKRQDEESRKIFELVKLVPRREKREYGY